MDDSTWMALMLLLLAYGQKNPHDISIPEIKPDDLPFDLNRDLTAGVLQAIRNFNAEQFEADQQYQNNCPNVEWEQDMGMTIPFCKLDGEMCNLQCKRRLNDIFERRT